VIGYVVMPEHVHLLISEPLIANPSTVVQAVKLGFTQRWFREASTRVPHFSRSVREACPERSRRVGPLAGEHNDFWQRRFYDFNLWSQRKEIEKLRYLHRNPVVRGLVADPADWRWSSYRSYAYGEPGSVRINDWRRWEEKIRVG